MKKIPFSKINIPKKVVRECKKILKSGNLTNNRYVEQFEKEVAEISGTKYAVATNSCTTGLMLVCREVFKGLKKIGLPDYTWPSTKSAIIDNGFKPVWLDVDTNTWCIENCNLKPANGYLVVDTFGNQCNIDTDKPVIADCAHSFGVPFHRGYIAGVYSFALAKTFTGGEGGAIVTNDKELYDKLKNTVRWAGRMQEVNACIGLYYIRQYRKIIEEKEKIVEYYQQHLPFTFQEFTNSNYNIVNVVCKNKKERDFIFNKIKDKLGTKIRYTLDSGKSLPVSQSLFEKSFFIPIWKGINYKKVVKIILEALK